MATISRNTLKKLMPSALPAFVIFMICGILTSIEPAMMPRPKHFDRAAFRQGTAKWVHIRN